MLVKQVPTFAPAWKDMAILSTDKKERLAAIETGLANSPDAETRGMLLLNKAIILNNSGGREAAIRLLTQLAQDKDSTLATEQLAKTTLSTIIKK